MASSGLPPLPSRNVGALPKLPPRSGLTTGSNTGVHNSSQEVVLPPLPSRSSSTHSSDAPSGSHPHETTSNHSFSSTAVPAPPLLPQRTDLMTGTRSSTNPTAHSAPLTESEPASTKLRAKELNAFGAYHKDEASHDGSSQPRLPKRSAASTAISTDHAPMPPLPSTYTKNLGNSAMHTPVETSEQPPLPSRRTQSHAPPMTSNYGNTGKFPTQHPSHETTLQKNGHLTASNANRVSPAPPLPSHNNSPPPSSAKVLPTLPNHTPQHASSDMGKSSEPRGRATTLFPSSQPPQLPPSVSTAPLPASAPLALPTIVASGSAPKLPSRSVGARSSSAAPPPIDRSTQHLEKAEGVRSSSVAPPPIGRSTQHVEKAEHASSAHSVGVVGGTSSSTGLYLGSGAYSSSSSPSHPTASMSPSNMGNGNNTTKIPVARAPLLPAQQRAPPPLPASVTTPPATTSNIAPPPLPPSAIAPGNATNAKRPFPSGVGNSSTLRNSKTPQLLVTPDSPNASRKSEQGSSSETRRRSRSFDAGSAPPPIPPRAATPDARPPSSYGTTSTISPSSSYRASVAPRRDNTSPSSSSSSSSTSHKDLSVPHSDHGHERTGRKRANSADEFSGLVRSLTEDHVASGQYSVMVMTPQKQEKHVGEKEFMMMYPIEVSKGSQKWTIFRRFNQFYNLDNDLKKHHLFKKAGISSSMPPKNSSASKTDPLLLESRRRAFQKYLTELCAVAVIADSDQFYMFIQPFQMGDIKPPS